MPKTGPERLYYRCGGRFKNAVKCSMPTLTVHRVDTLFWDWIKESMLDHKNLRRELERQRADQDERAALIQKELDAEQSRLAQLATQVERLLELYADDRIPRSALDTQISTKVAAQEAIKQRMNELDEQLQSPLTQDTIEGLVAFAERVAARFEDIEREDDFLFKQELVAILDARAVAFREDGLQKLRFRSMLRETVFQYRQRPTSPLSRRRP